MITVSADPSANIKDCAVSTAGYQISFSKLLTHTHTSRINICHWTCVNRNDLSASISAHSSSDNGGDLLVTERISLQGIDWPRMVDSLAAYTELLATNLPEDNPCLLLTWGPLTWHRFFQIEPPCFLRLTFSLFNSVPVSCLWTKTAHWRSWLASFSSQG